MKATIIICTVLLAGCGRLPAEEHSSITDQCLRAQLFQQCLTALPQGPVSTHNSNDWDEVVDSCNRYSYSAAQRAPEYITPECRMER